MKEIIQRETLKENENAQLKSTISQIKTFTESLTKNGSMVDIAELKDRVREMKLF